MAQLRNLHFNLRMVGSNQRSHNDRRDGGVQIRVVN
jgi:hypothetical protein